MSIDIEPISPHDHLAEIWQGIPLETLIMEEGRLRERYAELGGRILLIAKIREGKQYDQHTLFDEVPGNE